MTGRFAGRFTGRAESYSRYRPDYPMELISILNRQIAFDQGKAVADIGSGIRSLSRLFLQNGNKVFGVEPDAEMRSYAEKNLHSYSRFVSVD